jgi:hypothetical protein
MRAVITFEIVRLRTKGRAKRVSGKYPTQIPKV